MDTANYFYQVWIPAYAGMTSGSLYDASKEAMIMSYQETYRRSWAEPEAFGAEGAGEIDWEKRGDGVLDDGRPPFYRWFAGARLNTCWNALDRHVAAGRGERVALIWGSPVTDTIARFTYREMRDRVARVARRLHGPRGKRGAPPLIFLPLVPA